jgi:hypothetical protein
VRTHVSLGKDAPCARPIERFGGKGKRLVIENGAEAEVSAGLAAMIGEAEPRAGAKGNASYNRFRNRFGL